MVLILNNFTYEEYRILNDQLSIFETVLHGI